MRQTPALTQEGAKPVEPIPFETDPNRLGWASRPEAQLDQLLIPAEGRAHRLGRQHVEAVGIDCVDDGPLGLEQVGNEIAQCGHAAFPLPSCLQGNRV